METEHEKNIPEKKPERMRKRRPLPPPGIKDDITTLAHISLLIYCGIICYMCWSHPIKLFTWHPLLLTIGWTLLSAEGILFMSKENILSRRLTRTWKLRLHYGLLAIGGVLIAVGFIAVVVTKNELKREHFQSWHAIFGLIGIIAFIPGYLNGIPALYDAELKKFIRPNLNKSFHEASGTVGFLFGGLSLILSVFTKWFEHHSNGNKYLFLISFVTVTFSMVWIVQRPLRKSARKFFKVQI